MEKHIANARAIIAFLNEHVAIEQVHHPELTTHPDHQLEQQLLPKGAGSVVSFVIKGGRKAGQKFIEALRLFSHVANVGDAKSLAIHPASTTHFRVPAEQLAAGGITEGSIRLSIGLESVQDLITDLDRALKIAQKG